MSDTLRLVSTTDTPEQVEAAMARATGEPVTPPADGAAATAEATAEGAAAVVEGEPPPAEGAAAEVDPKVSEAARVLAESKRSKADERKASIQAEIDKLNWQKHHTASLVAAEEKRLADLQAEAAKVGKPAEAAPAVAQRPKVEDFADYDQFTEALADWKAEIKVAAVRAEIKAITDGLKARDDSAQQTTEQQQIAAIEAAHTERVATYAKAQADYADVMAAAASDPQFAMSPQMYAHMVNSDMGPELAYALAKLPPAEFRAIADLPERRMLATLGRLEGKILASRPAVAPPTGPTAKAPLNLPPPPPKPVSGSGSASTKSPDQMTPAEYSAWRRKTRAS